ncbi:hypothetical protein [uncultured Roseibium sp.]|uniref:SRPBCC family protein n=1 Tax=uncultured Roseibium sp. TaxID=1936171 RepID=UPI0032171554
MTDGKTEEPVNGLEFVYEFNDPPQKVWRAISIPEFRENWLPNEALAETEATSVTPGREIRYRLREDSPPYLESIVTFRITPNAAGGTSLRIVHELDDARFDKMTKAAANGNSLAVMRAA